MMRYLVGLVVVLSCLFVAPLLQCTTLYRAAPGDVTIDLVLVLTVSIGAVFGSLAGLTSGILGGLMLGTACGNLAGLFAALYGMMGAVAGLVPWHGLRSSVVAGLVAMVLTAGLLVIELVALHASELPHLLLQTAALLALYHGMLTIPVTVLLSLLLLPRRDLLLTAVAL